uniref:Uncharacterized protein n=1 Tax=Strigamia maritima TaxID=126957 RepID=T1JL59_STRMM
MRQEIVDSSLVERIMSGNNFPFEIFEINGTSPAQDYVVFGCRGFRRLHSLGVSLSQNRYV